EHVVYTYHASCTDPEGDDLILGVGPGDTCGGTVTDYGRGIGTYSFTPSEDQGQGSCVLSLACSDGQTQAVQTVTVSVAEISTAPVIASTPAGNAYDLVAYRYEVLCSDFDGDAVEIAVGAGDTCGGILVETGDGTALYEFTPAVEEVGSVCTLEITCSDTQAVDAQSLPVTVEKRPASWMLVPFHPGRRGHAATMLLNGLVLLTGGQTSTTTFNMAQACSSETGWCRNTGFMFNARSQHTATLLADGRVLVAGGGAVTRGEVYDPATETWMPTALMVSPRQYHTATRLANGKVLVVGGANGSTLLGSAELYDPATGIWVGTGALSVARQLHTATLLSNGKVLVAGGRDSTNYLGTAELYDPSTGTWTSAGPLSRARSSHTATRLPDGRVLLAGGANSVELVLPVELYDPATNAWAPSGSLNTGRARHTATLLSSGTVLVAGGINGVEVSSAEIYDPATGAWTPTGSFNVGRMDHTATLLPDGRVFVTGGVTGMALHVTSAELYHP
ncbi:MAG: branched-chain amino acid ABC transporter substrate-binding protein, partial [Deltaproteobacteria bacterium HGW-Deltaproteobacteria-17]